MKKFVFVLTVLVALLTLVSCSKKEPDDIPEGMTYKENEIVDYYLYFPEGWIIDRNDGMVSARVSDKDHSNVSVTSFTSPQDIVSVEEYLEKEYIGYYKDNFPDINILSDAEEVTLGGIDARQFVFTMSVAGEKYKFRQIITYRYGYIYILTYTSTEEGFDTHIEEVNDIVREFKFK